jgi:hypothetical protein
VFKAIKIWDVSYMFEMIHAKVVHPLLLPIDAFQQGSLIIFLHQFGSTLTIVLVFWKDEPMIFLYQFQVIPMLK